MGLDSAAKSQDSLPRTVRRTAPPAVVKSKRSTSSAPTAKRQVGINMSVSGDIVDYIESTDRNIFVTGKAGSGKSIQLKRYIERNGSRALVVAPTGIAAINCDGETIHRMFALPITPVSDKDVADIAKRAKKSVRAASVLVCDEVGMVRADTWDLIDRLLRIIKRCDEPFGGIRVICFGDLYQLPPIVKSHEVDHFAKKYGSPYFFSARTMKEQPFQVVEMTRVFRQKDNRFIKILNEARIGNVTREAIDALNTRYRPDFEAADGFVTLSPRNADVDRINAQRLNGLPGKFVTYHAECNGKVPNKLPNDETVFLKEDCQVMVIKNVYLEDKKMIPNGKVGIARKCHDDSVDVEIDGRIHNIEYAEWDMHSTRVVGDQLVGESEGCFRQIPLRVAYACTIHKSQGVTLDKVIIDMSGGAFADGQTYVALSRCRSLDGIILKSRLAKSDIRADKLLSNFMTEAMKQGHYLEYIQDEIKDFGGVEVQSPMDEIRAGASTGKFVSEPEMDAMYDVLRMENPSDSHSAASLLLPRLIDEIRALRTKTGDMQRVIHGLKGTTPDVKQETETEQLRAFF